MKNLLIVLAVCYHFKMTELPGDAGNALISVILQYIRAITEIS